MRRAALWVGLVASGAIAPAQASPTTLTAEGGAEIDSNVERVEKSRANTQIGAAVGRLGVKVDHRGKAVAGTYVLHLSALARVIGDRIARAESAALLVGDLKWVRPVGTRPVSAGLGVTVADALPLNDPTGTRTFRSLGADGLLVLRGGEDRTLTIAFGARSFTYKPDRVFDWSGPAASIRLDLTLWQPAGGTKSVELAAYAGVEARSYNDVAFANVCADDAMPENPKSCFAATSLPRNDRYHRLGAELTWVGRVVAAAGYQLAVTDSNSFGQSLVRHRVNLSATTGLPWRLFGTALATIQFDQYLDGSIVEEDVGNQTFTTLDDENRSSLQLRLARQISKTWSVETRAAIWTDLGADNAASFRRALAYLGVVYSH